MSLSWNRPRLRIFLQPGGLTLVRLGGRLRPRIEEKLRLRSEQFSWQSALDLLELWLREHEPAPFEFVLSSQFARFLVLPFDAALAADTDRLALAQALFDRHHAPESAIDFEFRLDSISFGKPQLAVAVERTLLAALRQLAERQRQPLLTVAPLLEAAWNQFQGQLPAHGTLAVAEDSRLLLARFAQGRIVEVQMQPTIANALPPALINAESHAPLCLFAPQWPLASSGASSLRRLTLPACNGFSPLQDTDLAFGLCGVLA